MTLVHATQLNQLREILESSPSLKYTDEELASAGLAIIRFVVCKERQMYKSNLREDLHCDD